MRTVTVAVFLALLVPGCSKSGEEAGEKKILVVGPDTRAAPAGAKPVPEEFVGTTETDPVCGMQVEVKKDTPFSVHTGKHYFFCCTGCKASFDKEAAKYVKP